MLQRKDLRTGTAWLKAAMDGTSVAHFKSQPRAELVPVPQKVLMAVESSAAHGNCSIIIIPAQQSCLTPNTPSQALTREQICAHGMPREKQQNKKAFALFPPPKPVVHLCFYVSSYISYYLMLGNLI